MRSRRATLGAVWRRRDTSITAADGAEPEPPAAAAPPADPPPEPDPGVIGGGVVSLAAPGGLSESVSGRGGGELPAASSDAACQDEAAGKLSRPAQPARTDDASASAHAAAAGADGEPASSSAAISNPLQRGQDRDAGMSGIGGAVVASPVPIAAAPS